MKITKIFLHHENEELSLYHLLWSANHSKYNFSQMQMQSSIFMFWNHRSVSGLDKQSNFLFILIIIVGVNSIILQLNCWKIYIYKVSTKYQQSINKRTLEELRERMTPHQLKANDIARCDGASIWLMSLSLKEENYVLNKQEFFDGIYLRYMREMKNLPSICACDAKFPFILVDTSFNATTTCVI